MRAIEPILASGIVVMLITIVLDDKQEGRKMDKKHLADVLEDELVQKLMLGDENFLDELRKYISEKISPDDQRVLSAIFNLMNKVKSDKDKKIETLEAELKKRNPGEGPKNAANEFAYKMLAPMKEALEKAERKRKNKPPSPYSIADYFNQKEYKPRSGERFRHSTIVDLIKRQKELGLLDLKNE